MAQTKHSKQNGTDLTSTADDVFEAEKKYLKLGNQKVISGFAISGGGIRSASFGLGVMQGLVSNNLLSKMDYMSTVSGGGYLGSALTWALKQGGKDVGTTPDKFPLGKKNRHGRKDASSEERDLDDLDNKLLDFIRQHCTYLTPTSKLDIVSFATVVMRSMTMSLSVYFSFLTIAMTISIWVLYCSHHVLETSQVFLSFKQLTIEIGNALGCRSIFPTIKGLLISIGVVLLIIITFFGFIYSLRTYFVSESGKGARYKRFINGQIINGFLLKLSLTSIVLGTLPFITQWIGELTTYLAASGLTVFGTLVGLWQYIKAQKSEKNEGTSSDILIYAGTLALFYGVLLLAYMCATKVFLNGTHIMVYPIGFVVLILLSFCFGYLANLNLIGPHRLWRDRLMEAFMPNKNAVSTNVWEPADEADGALMEDMCDENNPKPYHLVNTNIILSNSPKVKFKGRGGDNFIISPLYCGSDSTGWKTTATFQKKYSRGITLATAMATSAAALNPNAGVSGEGVTRNVVVSILLSMLNLRLGYWTSNPADEKKESRPNFFVPGLTSEILHNGYCEKDSNIQLSDGGHFENLAFYELIRRKLNLIVVSDGGADLGFNFDDLANTIEKARVDFGAKITFKEGYKLDSVLPDTSGISDFQKRYDIAKQGFAIADIEYNDHTKGTLVYLKLAMIEGLPTDVYSYKGLNPDFPHQSTADQFFDEKQFEAYRELGYYVAWQMMESEGGKEALKKLEENEIV